MEKGSRRSKRQSRRRPSRKTLFGRIRFEFRWIRRNDKWVLPLIATIVIGMITIVLSFLRLWKVTPAWVEPSVRISLIDFAQAWSLEQSATGYEQQGNNDQAFAAWTGASANNPGRVQSLEGVMRCLAIKSPSQESKLLTPVYGKWLLQITQTNLSSIVCFAELLEKNHCYSEALKLISSVTDGSDLRKFNDASLRAIQLRCNFASERFDAFTQVWNQLPPEQKNDSNLELQSLGIAALKDGNSAVSDRFVSSFNLQLTLNPAADAKIQTLRTGLRVFAESGRTNRTQRILDDLISLNAATLSDHAKHWNALLQSGDPRRIVELSKNAPTPITEKEALGLVRFFLRANLPDLAERKTVELLNSPWSSPLLWMERGDQLIRQERWPELKQIGLNLRGRTASPPLLAIANYWEGFAEDRLENRHAAIASFRRIVEHQTLPSGIAARLATKIDEIGYPEEADAVATSLDGSSTESRRFWTLRCSDALKQKDLDSFHAYAQQGYDSDPDFLPHINNLAAALLLKRVNPDKSLALTTKLVAENDSFLFRLNHAHALIQNNEVGKAEDLLDSIAEQVDSESPAYPDYAFARFEVASVRKNTTDALQWLSHIQIDQFLPEVGQWIKKSLSNLKPSSKEG